MLGNGIKQTTTSVGTGGWTLAAVAGSPTLIAPSGPFTVGRQFSYVAYTGTDAAPVFREAGIGVMTSSTAMTRPRISATFDGTATYNDINPTPTDFGGATVTVICTPHAATTPSVLVTVDGQTAGINRFLTSAGRSAGQSPQGLGINLVSYVPFLLRSGATVVALAYSVTAAVASSVMRLGIYTVNEKGYIGKLLATTADIDTSATGVKVGTLATPITLPPGDYYTAVVASAGITGISYTTGNGHILGGGPLGHASGSVTVIELRTETVASTVLPASASLTTTGVTVSVTHPPCVFLGVQ